MPSYFDDSYLQDNNALSEHMAQTYQQIMQLPPSILAKYLESLQSSQGVPLTAILQQSLTNYAPGSDPNYVTGMGYTGVNNTPGRTVRDIIRDMGQQGGVTGGNQDQWQQPTHGTGGNRIVTNPDDQVRGNTAPPPVQALNPQDPTGGGATPPVQNIPAPGDYPFMFTQEMLRGLTNNSMSGIQGLTPMQDTPFSFSGAGSPTVGNTKNLINALVQRYRGI